MQIDEIKTLINTCHRNLKNYTYNTKTNQIEQCVSCLDKDDPDADQYGKIIKSPKKCPECHRNLIVILVEGLEAESCVFCQSLWFDKSELRTLTCLTKDVPGETLPHRKSKYKCPICQEVMNEYVFSEHGNLLIDKCLNGHGVYLEAGELKRIMEMLGNKGKITCGKLVSFS